MKYPKLVRFFRLGSKFELAGERDENATQYMRIDIVKEREKKLIEIAAFRIKKNLTDTTLQYATDEVIKQVILNQAGIEELK